MNAAAKPAQLTAATHVMKRRLESAPWTCDRSSDRPGLLILLAPRRRIVGASPTAFTIVGPVTRAAKGTVS